MCLFDSTHFSTKKSKEEVAVSDNSLSFLGYIYIQSSLKNSDQKPKFFLNSFFLIFIIALGNFGTDFNRHLVN